MLTTFRTICLTTQGALVRYQAQGVIFQSWQFIFVSYYEDVKVYWLFNLVTREVCFGHDVQFDKSFTLKDSLSHDSSSLLPSFSSNDVLLPKVEDDDATDNDALDDGTNIFVDITPSSPPPTPS